MMSPGSILPPAANRACIRPYECMYCIARVSVCDIARPGVGVEPRDNAVICTSLAAGQTRQASQTADAGRGNNTSN